MTERPILFNAEMVRAVLAGTKTQTRRAIRPQPVDGDRVFQFGHGFSVGRLRDSENAIRPIRCPYGVPGDRLWAREAFHIGESASYADGQSHAVAVHRASVDAETDAALRWRPSIHMPRWASRITLEVTDVRVERLQDISEADAIAEGAQPLLVPPDGGGRPHVEGYRALWEQINGAGSWARIEADGKMRDTRCWVWVVSFRRLP